MEENNKPKSEINLRKLMQKLGLGTNAFAEKCGMSSQSMSQFLRNKSLTTNTIYRIATALDIDPRDMFFPTDEKESSYPTTMELQDIMRKAYPSIKKENIEEIVKMIDEKGRVSADRNKLEEARKRHEGETLNTTLRGDLPEGTIHRDVKFVQQAAESEPAYPVHENGLVTENQQQQMIQTSTFCPHCGKKVRVGVVLLPDE
jgi:transcriptional regulator with XRE-family HTH domain